MRPRAALLRHARRADRPPQHHGRFRGTGVAIGATQISGPSRVDPPGMAPALPRHALCRLRQYAPERSRRDRPSFGTLKPDRKRVRAFYRANPMALVAIMRSWGGGGCIGACLWRMPAAPQRNLSRRAPTCSTPSRSVNCHTRHHARAPQSRHGTGPAGASSTSRPCISSARTHPRPGTRIGIGVGRADRRRGAQWFPTPMAHHGRQCRSQSYRTCGPRRDQSRLYLKASAGPSGRSAARAPRLPATSCVGPSSAMSPAGIGRQDRLVAPIRGSGRALHRMATPAHDPSSNRAVSASAAAYFPDFGNPEAGLVRRHITPDPETGIGSERCRMLKPRSSRPPALNCNQAGAHDAVRFL